MIKHSTILIVILLSTISLQAQFHTLPLITDSTLHYEATETQKSILPRKWQVHGTVGTGVEIGSGYVTSYLAASPRVDYHPNDRLTISAGFTLLGTADPNRFMLRGNQPRSLTPTRQGNVSASVAAYIAGEYRVSDRLWVAASLFHAGGQMIMPTSFTPWGYIPGGWTADVNLTAFNAAMSLKVGDDTYIHLQCSFLRDGSGQFWPYYTSPFYSSYMYGFAGGWTPYGGFGGPAGIHGWNSYLSY